MKLMGAVTESGDRMRVLRAVAGVASGCLVAGMLALGAPSSAAPAPVDPEAEAFAATVDISVEQAAAELDDQQAFGELVTKLTETYGESNVDAWIEHGDDGPRYMVRTRSDSVERAVASVAARSAVAEPAVEVVSGEDWMLADRNAYMDAQWSTWEAITPHLDGGYVDISTGELVLSVTGEATQEEIDALVAASALPTRVLVGDEPTQDNNRGGLNLNSCTSGFAVTNGSLKGFLTAAHCGNQLWYPAGSSTSYVSTLQAQTYNSNADISARSIASSFTLYAQVWTGATFLNITGTASSVPGTHICSRGKTSGYRCGMINSQTYKPAGNLCPSGTCNASFAIVATASGVGDSGGPWLGSGKAYGIHKGHSSTVGSIYSKIGYRPNGWAIYTG